MKQIFQLTTVLILLISCNNQVLEKKTDHEEVVVVNTKSPAVNDSIFCCDNDLNGTVASHLLSIKGIGLININYDNSMILDFFYDSSLRQKVFTIELIPDPKLSGLFCIKSNSDSCLHFLRPLALFLEFGIFTFQCVDSTANTFKVISNEFTDKAFWLKRTEKIEFQPWSQYILDKIAVEPINPDENPIREKPDMNSPLTKNQPVHCLKPVEIDGEWLKVETEPTNCDKYLEMKEDEMATGYIRWKIGNKLLINYYSLL